MHRKLEDIRGTFDRYGLFSDTGGSVTGNEYKSVATKIDDWYGSFNQIAYRSNDGDFEKAERFLDCSFYMFFWRLKQKKDYSDWYKEVSKQVGNK